MREIFFNDMIKCEFYEKNFIKRDGQFSPMDAFIFVPELRGKYCFAR